MSTTPTLDELQRLRGEAGKLGRRPGEILDERTALAAEIEQLRAELAEYHYEVSSGKRSNATRENTLTTKLQTREAALRDGQWETRHAGALLTARRSRDAVDQFIRERHDSLARDLALLAEEAQQAVLDAGARLIAAIDGYRRMDSLWAPITNQMLGQGRVNRMPYTPKLDRAAAAIGHVLDDPDGVPSPIPSTVAAAQAVAA